MNYLIYTRLSSAPHRLLGRWAQSERQPHAQRDSRPGAMPENTPRQTRNQPYVP